jgi:hypothetical protein
VRCSPHRELLALEPNVLFLDNRTMDAHVAAMLLPAKAGAISVSAVGVVAMALASIGLYGVSFKIRWRDAPPS